MQKKYVQYRALVGKIIAAHRARASLDQATLAAKLGITQTSLSRLESGQSGFSVEQIALAAAALDTTPGSIIGEADRAAEMFRAQGYEVVRVKEEAKPDWTPLAAGVIAGILIALALRGGK